MKPGSQRLPATLRKTKCRFYQIDGIMPWRSNANQQYLYFIDIRINSMGTDEEIECIKNEMREVATNAMSIAKDGETKEDLENVKSQIEELARLGSKLKQAVE